MTMRSRVGKNESAAVGEQSLRSMSRDSRRQVAPPLHCRRVAGISLGRTPLRVPTPPSDPLRHSDTMAELRTGRLSHVNTVSAESPRHEEHAALPRSPRALAQGPEGLIPRRAASTSESHEVPSPELPRLRMTSPST